MGLVKVPKTLAEIFQELQELETGGYLIIPQVDPGINGFFGKIQKRTQGKIKIAKNKTFNETYIFKNGQIKKKKKEGLNHLLFDI